MRAIERRASSVSNAALSTQILPTIYEDAGSRIVELIGKLKPMRLLMFGLAAEEMTVRIENVALNINDAEGCDNTGVLRCGNPIAKDGPLALASTAPITQWRDVIQSSGHNVRISHHAGTFVCNHIYYTALREIDRLDLACEAAFIHLPNWAPDAPEIQTLSDAIVRLLNE